MRPKRHPASTHGRCLGTRDVVDHQTSINERRSNPRWLPNAPLPLLGFSKVGLPTSIVITDGPILTGERGPCDFVAFDATVLERQNGKNQYAPIIEFVSRQVCNYWSETEIAVPRVEHSEVFQ